MPSGGVIIDACISELHENAKSTIVPNGTQTVRFSDDISVSVRPISTKIYRYVENKFLFRLRPKSPESESISGP